MPDSIHRSIADARLITQDAELDDLCRRWRDHGLVGLDTEFFRERTYYPIPALIQVAGDDACWLLDPLALDDLRPLLELLADDAVTKVMHAPVQDLEIFRLKGADSVRSLYDTQTAAIFAGLGEGPGYQSLVSELLGTDLPKTETRSDWRKRPLSPAQLRYAAQDVAYLLALKDKLDEHLAALDRMEWLREECDRLVEQAWVQDDAAGLRKLRQAWRLPPINQEALKRLWLWRERRARELDRPRQRVLKDPQLQQIARDLPDSQGALARMDFPPGWIRRFADEVLALCSEVRSIPEADLEPSFLPPARHGAAGNRLKLLQKKVSELSEKLNLPGSFLVNRQTLESLATDPPKGSDLPQGLRGWRADAVGRELLSVLSDSAETDPEG